MLDAKRMARSWLWAPVLMTLAMIATAVPFEVIRLMKLGYMTWSDALLMVLHPLGFFYLATSSTPTPMQIALIISAIGFIGGLINNELSKGQAIKAMDVTLLDETHHLHQRVGALADRLGMPRPAVGTCGVTNAFAVGSSERDSCVVIGRPLLALMPGDELDAIIGHELGHVATRDVQRMQMATGFPLIFNVAISFASSTAQIFGNRTNNHNERAIAQIVVVWLNVLKVTLFFGAEMIMRAMSRNREFYADAVGALLTSPATMTRALERIHGVPISLSAGEQRFGSLMLVGFSGLFSTHPTLEKRREALQSGQYLKRIGGKSMVLELLEKATPQVKQAADQLTTAANQAAGRLSAKLAERAERKAAETQSEQPSAQSRRGGNYVDPPLGQARQEPSLGGSAYQAPYSWDEVGRQPQTSRGYDSPLSTWRDAEYSRAEEAPNKTVPLFDYGKPFLPESSVAFEQPVGTTPKRNVPPSAEAPSSKPREPILPPGARRRDKRQAPRFRTGLIVVALFALGVGVRLLEEVLPFSFPCWAPGSSCFESTVTAGASAPMGNNAREGAATVLTGSTEPTRTVAYDVMDGLGTVDVKVSRTSTIEQVENCTFEQRVSQTLSYADGKIKMTAWKVRVDFRKAKSVQLERAVEWQRRNLDQTAGRQEAGWMMAKPGIWNVRIEGEGAVCLARAVLCKPFQRDDTPIQIFPAPGIEQHIIAAFDSERRRCAP